MRGKSHQVEHIGIEIRFITSTLYDEVLWQKNISVQCKICITNESLPYAPMLSPIPKRMYIKFSGSNGVDGGQMDGD